MSRNAESPARSRGSRHRIGCCALSPVGYDGLSNCKCGQHGCKLMESDRRDLRVDWILSASCIHKEAAIWVQILTRYVKPLFRPSGEAALDLDGPQALTGNLQQ